MRDSAAKEATGCGSPLNLRCFRISREGECNAVCREHTLPFKSSHQAAGCPLCTQGEAPQRCRDVRERHGTICILNCPCEEPRALPGERDFTGPADADLLHPKRCRARPCVKGADQKTCCLLSGGRSDAGISGEGQGDVGEKEAAPLFARGKRTDKERSCPGVGRGRVIVGGAGGKCQVGNGKRILLICDTPEQPHRVIGIPSQDKVLKAIPIPLEGKK